MMGGGVFTKGWAPDFSACLFGALPWSQHMSFSNGCQSSRRHEITDYSCRPAVSLWSYGCTVVNASNLIMMVTVTWGWTLGWSLIEKTIIIWLDSIGVFYFFNAFARTGLLYWEPSNMYTVQWRLDWTHVVKHKYVCSVNKKVVYNRETPWVGTRTLFNALVSVPAFCFWLPPWKEVGGSYLSSVSGNFNVCCHGFSQLKKL